MKDRNCSLDLLKLFCIIGVICIHTNPFGGSLLGSIINIVINVSVPLFFICSGYFFYNKCTKQYVINYTKNLFKFLVTWITIYIFYDLTINILANVKESRYMLGRISDLFRNFNILDIYYATGIVKYHLWYLSTMIILLPILYFIIKKNILDEFVILALGLNIIGVIIPVFINNSLRINVRDAIFFGFFYCAIGAYIKKVEIRIKKMDIKLKYLVISIFFLFVVFIVEKYIYIRFFKGCGDFFISTIPLSIMIFIFFIYNNKLITNLKIVNIGRNTLGIYIIHPLIISIIELILYKLNIQFIKSNVLWQIVYTPTILLTSYISYNIIQIIKLNVGLSVSNKLNNFFKSWI